MNIYLLPQCELSPRIYILLRFKWNFLYPFSETKIVQQGINRFFQIKLEKKKAIGAANSIKKKNMNFITLFTVLIISNLSTKTLITRK